MREGVDLLPKRHSVTDRSEYVLQFPASRTVVEDFGGGGDRDPVLLCPLPKKGLFGNVAVSPVPGNENVEVFPEGFPKLMRWLVGRDLLLESRSAASPERV